MKDLPDHFQFRLSGEKYSGYTHSAKRNAHGDYEIKWARGWANIIGQVPWVITSQEEVETLVKDGEWVIVDEKSKQENSASALPDEFYFSTSAGPNYKAVKRDGYYQVTWPGEEEGITYGLNTSRGCVKVGIWKIIDKKPLTAEQQKQLKEFREQIAQLDSSIKLNQQDICHKERLVANYEQRKSDVLSKIAELEVK